MRTRSSATRSLYGATARQASSPNGRAGERFGVRNSGATVVIEGCGSNGCEYMTGGTAVILGRFGDNFGAGMTGGMAFLYDPEGEIDMRLNTENVISVAIESSDWAAELRALIEEHLKETGSPRAADILRHWEDSLPKFRQIVPKEMLSRLKYPLSDKPAAATA